MTDSTAISSYREAATNSSLLTCAFNQDGGCLAIGTTSGFSVHNLHPQYAVSVKRELSGGVGLVEMLFRCNLMVLVGGGPSPLAPPHRVLIHDDHVNKPIGELSFRQVVLAARLRKDAIAVALRDRVYVYHLADLTLRDKIYTSDNPHGLLCVSTQIQDMVVACPSVTTGHVRVELYGMRKTVVRFVGFHINDARCRSKVVVDPQRIHQANHQPCVRLCINFQLMEAHESQLRALALTADGSLLATASEKGTVIRVWDVASAACVRDFRRGVERANITCLSWSWDHAWLCCTSDKGTAHVFAATDNNSTKEGVEEKKHTDSVSSMAHMLYTSVRKSVEGDARKSICQIRGVPHPQACAFVTSASTTSSHVVAVAGWDADGNGVLLLSEFSVSCAHNGGGEEPMRIGYHVLCKSSLPDETEEARRRRRLRGWTPEIPQTPEGGRLYVGERLEILEQGMDQIHFEEGGIDDDEFVSVTTVPLQSNEKIENIPQEEINSGDSNVEASTYEEAKESHEIDASAAADSVQTVAWDDDPNASGSKT